VILNIIMAEVASPINNDAQQDVLEYTIAEELEDNSVTSSIIVNNVARTTEQRKTLVDFFSFCGNITALSIIPDDQDESIVSAVITFDSPVAARTAVLLNNTPLNEKFISVHLAPTEQSGQDTTEVFPKLHTAERTQTSIISELLAKGYQLSQQALQNAREYDEANQITATMNQLAKEVEASVTSFDQEHKITETIQQFAQLAKVRVVALDQTYQISTNAMALGDSVKDKLAQLEEEHNISSRVESATGAVVAGVQQGANQVNEFLATNETAKAGIEQVSAIGNYINDALTSWLGDSTVNQASTLPVVNQSANIVVNTTDAPQ